MEFTTEDAKYEALKNRDPQAEGKFIYAVKSTKIYCRPTCYSRLALRKNIMFLDSSQQAIALGYRSCKRCRPDVSRGWNTSRELVDQACRLIFEQAIQGCKLSMDAIIIQLKISKWHLCRMFKSYTGYTPRSFHIQCKLLHQNPLEGIPLPEIQTKKNKLRVNQIIATIDIDTLITLH
ncbi:uncharacterized protein SPAPADRAFT_70814 [Spathaspora passalidarum NRRL Y-27907]|uniref:Ada DNA repair metal-binding domain-containing protein n=1 Tax=Spathaspora passalidarum (strain NRRL Y-27907 / 11-Y1) TaxID=619300 RepID=G3AK27_SPAPN|nr:uncharacterized protein SPAPADRAFT_70814 [Spathaspora passalidarum NRRL Y-27907]EGW32838.1 hypothetical protein SPAPADRAFT_70814 [Spathaspora passalidarum NRRL Y-27907]